MKATAAVLREIGGGFSLEEIDIEGPRAGEVLVRITAAGICHTDLAARDGVLPIGFPGVVGHEGAGTVLEVGAGVRKVAPGDTVSVTFNSCGSCVTCRAGAPSYCENFMQCNYGGVRADGSRPLSQGGSPVSGMFFGQSSFATVALANERNVVKVPSDVPATVLAPLGCGVQTGVGAVTRSLGVEAGASVLVTGAGSVGLSAVLGATLAKAERIIAVEPSASRRSLALELGATDVIDPAAGDLAEQVRAVIPAGVNYAVDTSGIPAVIDGVVGCMAVRGTIGLIGVPASPDGAVALNIINTLSLGLTVTGIVEGDSNPDEFIPELVELYRSGRLPIDTFITAFPFAEINDAVAGQHRGDVVKPVLVFE
jgi:aryl-alcohol dehydrogenase